MAGVSDVPVRLAATWLDAARKALGANPVSFALLPMSELTSEHGYLAQLAAQGYTVTAPDAGDDTPAASTSSAMP